MTKIEHNKTTTQKRKLRIRGKVTGTKKRPRLTVFRSNKHIYLQVINDETGKVMVIGNDLVDKKGKGTKTEKAVRIAQDLLTKLKKSKISTLVFDRGAYRYHGRIKAVAETLREGGIKI